jgi:protein phosphatase methylesterase 1
MLSVRRITFLLLLAGGLILVSQSWADTRAFKIVDDPALDAAVAEARAEFLKTKPFNRLDAAILIPEPDGSWRRGSYNGDVASYPASCVKLAYLAAAMRWCREHNFPYNHLDHAVRPMIVKSDNVQTGVVVDTITSAPNIDDLTSTTDPRWAEWIERRHYTARLLESRGLLGNQVILHKTYPSNSGEWPTGAEKVARDVFGMNKMQPRLSASLMLELVKGAFEPEARDYMLELLEHDRWKSNSVLGFGLPPGSKYYNKPGLAYDTLEDIAYVVLPNGREFIVAVFSNAFCEPYSKDPSPHDSSQLGGFMELLLKKCGLESGCPPSVIRTVSDAPPFFEAKGQWKEETTATELGTTRVLLCSGGTSETQAIWHLAVPQAGKYEVCVRYVAAPDRGKAVYTVRHAEGETSVTLDQRRIHDRWIRLGDFKFDSGQGEVTLHGISPQGDASQASVCAYSARATLHPH